MNLKPYSLIFFEYNGAWIVENLHNPSCTPLLLCFGTAAKATDKHAVLELKNLNNPREVSSSCIIKAQRITYLPYPLRITINL